MNSLDVVIGRLNVTGISDFQLKNIEIKLSTSAVQIMIPRLEFDMLYSAFGTVDELINLDCKNQTMK